MRKVASIIFLIFIHGCASTSVTSFVDPAFKKEKYSKPVVWVVTTSLDDRLNLENGIVSMFQNQGVEAIRSSEIFPPTREFDSKAASKSILESGGDSLLLITPKKASGISHLKYEAVLHSLIGDKSYKVWVGSVSTELRQAGVTNDQTIEAVIESISQELVKQIIADGVVE